MSPSALRFFLVLVVVLSAIFVFLYACRSKSVDDRDASAAERSESGIRGAI